MVMFAHVPILCQDRQLISQYLSIYQSHWGTQLNCPVYIHPDPKAKPQLIVAWWHWLVTLIWVNIGSGKWLAAWYYPAIAWTNVDL